MKALFEVTFSSQDDIQIRTNVTTEANLNTYLWFKAIAAANDRLGDLEAAECTSFSLDNVRLVKYLENA